MVWSTCFVVYFYPPKIRNDVVDLCVETWRTLNPDHEVRFLSATSIFDWVPREDLPRQFENMQASHKADAVRIAVLDKPMKDIIGQEPGNRIFYHSDRID
eukprot:CAMPEP_0180519668 /NCGR_PEP_ID=MMETSP1036_2-20121128/55826_1 /TAXON_ID=632150 /ORGANISM="Azadinium spinosum, Strain 3D9" /LENGTH=99 /DNA_ID=CAMNT_0022532053 /DNA_START=376 /DNA_END=672 /DNA_ORIENTATION=-